MSRTLAQAVAAIYTQIVEPGKVPDTAALGNLLLAGATREAVISIEQLLTAEGVEGISTRFSWAAGVRAPSFLPTEVAIPSEASPLLLEAAAAMRKERRTNVEQLTGPIVEMRDPHDGWGEVSISTVRRGRSCEVRVSVRPDFLEEAHDWFSAHDTMLVSGKVVSSRGRPLRIPDPTTFMRVADTKIFTS